MPRRLLIALLTLVLTAPALLAQPPQQNEYVPIDQLPPQETLPAAPLLIGAYVVVWLGLMGYLSGSGGGSARWRPRCRRCSGGHPEARR